MLRKAFEQNLPLGEAVHRRMMRDFRLGGMPQAVAAYIKTNNLEAVDRVKRDILSLYDEDFIKIDDSGKASAMMIAIPEQLNKNANRYQISNTIPGERVDRITNIVRQMSESMVVNIAYHSDDPNAGLALTKDSEHFKMYLCDTGLFITLAFMDKEFTENEIYNKLLNDKLRANLGYVYENMIAQMLRSAGYELYYHTIPTNGGKKFYEVDFIITDGHKVSPIEVKSSGYKTHASLDAFCRKFSERIQRKLLIYTKDLKSEKGVIYLPVYMTMFL